MQFRLALRAHARASPDVRRLYWAREVGISSETKFESLTAIFKKRNHFCDFPFSSLGDVAIPERESTLKESR